MAHRANILHCKSLFILISKPNPCESLFYNCLKSMHMLESFLTSNMASFVRVQNQEGFVRVFFMATQDRQSPIFAPMHLILVRVQNQVGFVRVFFTATRDRQSPSRLFDHIVVRVQNSPPLMSQIRAIRVQIRQSPKYREVRESLFHCTSGSAESNFRLLVDIVVRVQHVCCGHTECLTIYV